MKNLYSELAEEVQKCILQNSYPDTDDADHVVDICGAVFQHLPDRSRTILNDMIAYLKSYEPEGNEIERSLKKLVRSLEAENTKFRLNKIVSEEDLFGSATAPHFELEQDDRSQALRLTSEIKNLVHGSKKIDAKHKTRLFKRITSVENELQKIKGNYDVILGGMSDFGEAFGKFGKDVKPLVDRMREIRNLARANTSEYDQLPPPDETRELPHPDDFDDD